jgi:hypothetical protein
MFVSFSSFSIKVNALIPSRISFSLQLCLHEHLRQVVVFDENERGGYKFDIADCLPVVQVLAKLEGLSYKGDLGEEISVVECLEEGLDVNELL